MSANVQHQKLPPAEFLKPENQMSLRGNQHMASTDVPPMMQHDQSAASRSMGHPAGSNDVDQYTMDFMLQ